MLAAKYVFVDLSLKSMVSVISISCEVAIKGKVAEIYHDGADVIAMVYS